MNWMSFFESKESINYSFGKGINAQIADDEEELFNLSSKEFENKNILKAYEYFFRSLENYNSENVTNENILLEIGSDELLFTLYQGSAKVTGKITKKTFYAEVIIIKKSVANVALKRYILERNYQLTYANYFSDDKYIKIKLFHDNSTMSPQKIFFPIRELALNSDFDKEHIKSEFSEIKLEEIKHLSTLDDEELQIKYNYLKIWIEEIETKVATLPSNDNAGMQSFLYLDFLFKVDYLLVPKFTINQKLAKKIREYFSSESTTIEAKNEEIREYVTQLKELSYENFCKNFYSAKYTFNQVDKSSYDDISNFINDSLSKIKWYKTNRYPQIIPTIYSYISFHSLYNYGMNTVLQDLFALLVKIQNPAYFSALGYKIYFNKEDETFNKRTISAHIDTIIKNNQEKYPALETFSDELNFTGFNEFSNSYYTQLQNLNFEDI